MRLTDRSRIVAHQRCPRARYWGYEWNGRGLAPDRFDIKMEAGIAVHYGFSLLLKGAPEDQTVEAACASYDESVATRGPELHEREDVISVVEEQKAVIEGLVRLAALRVIPTLAAEYELVDVEQELEADLSPAIKLMGRPDALLRHRDTGDYYVFSLKTTGRWDNRKLKDAEHDDQGLSESWLVEQTRQRPVEGVIMCWLIVGERKEYPKDSGQYVTWSPLVRGYRKFGPDGKAEYAWRFDWQDGDGATRRLGKGWTRFNVWEEPDGIKNWIRALDEQAIQPEAGDALAAQFFMPPPFLREPRFIGDWVKQTAAQEEEITSAIRRGLDLDAAFVQHHYACSYPSRCPFYNLCWGSPEAAASPLSHGFRVRVPHHEREARRFTNETPFKEETHGS